MNSEHASTPAVRGKAAPPAKRAPMHWLRRVMRTTGVPGLAGWPRVCGPGARQAVGPLADEKGARAPAQTPPRRQVRGQVQLGIADGVLMPGALQQRQQHRQQMQHRQQQMQQLISSVASSQFQYMSVPARARHFF